MYQFFNVLISVYIRFSSLIFIFKGPGIKYTILLLWFVIFIDKIVILNTFGRDIFLILIYPFQLFMSYVAIWLINLELLSTRILVWAPPQCPQRWRSPWRCQRTVSARASALWAQALRRPPGSQRASSRILLPVVSTSLLVLVVQVLLRLVNFMYSRCKYYCYHQNTK